MEHFFEMLNLSKNAIQIYLGCFGKYLITKKELNLIVTNLPLEDVSKALNELINIGLVIPIYPKDPKILVHYLAIPPFGAVSNYYENINENVVNIKTQIQLIVSKTLEKIFQENQLIELDTVLKATRELKKDIDEDIIIQKQDIEDIVTGMENLRVLSDALDGLHHDIKGITQNEFKNLIKILPTIENEIIEKIQSSEIKKNKEELIGFVSAAFKKNFDKMVEEFTLDLHEKIKKEFDNTLESMNTIINSTFQFRNDFKMLLLNMMTNFEVKINDIFDILKNKNVQIKPQMDSFKDVITIKINEIMQNSINSVVRLNDPINSVMENYLKIVSAPEKTQIDKIYQVNSLTKVSEEISNFIANAKQNLTIIVPNLESLVLPEHLKEVSSSIKIKIVSSEALTNSNVKKFVELTNVEYRMLRNETIIIIKGDNNHVLLGVIQGDSPDPLNNFVGVSSNYAPFVKMLDTLVNTLLEVAVKDSFQIPKSIGVEGVSTDVRKQMKSANLLESKSISREEPTPSSTPTPSPIKTETISKNQKKEPPTEIPKVSPRTAQADPKSSVKPKPKDQSSIIIDTAFTTLIQKMGSLKGKEFSEELQAVANLILEQKGFSVTLHKIRSTINQYKVSEGYLNELDMKQVIASIEDWKSHLL
ncbi:MAG: hypothetical protein MUP85_03775 [Candidatus Lokiarchaeota archaeon]|nr:hypothetical protein [Candidatus Lokiarchaeota archaeon]